MTKIFIDTNIFLEVILRKGEKSNKSLRLLKNAKNLWTNSLVFCEIEWVLRDGYERSRSEIADRIRSFLNLSNIEIKDRNLLKSTVDLYENSKADWVDCLNASMLKNNKVTEIYSYDKHFDKFEWLTRREP